MASVLCLRTGLRFDFTENAYACVDDKGKLQFLGRRTLSGCLRIMLHRGAWVIDARKCKDEVSAAGKVLNDKPRMLRSRAIVKVGEERFLFAVSKAELAAAYEKLRDISQRRASVGDDPFNQIVDAGGDAASALEESDTPTESLQLDGEGMLDPDDKLDAPSEWTLTGVAEQVISREVENLHERSGKERTDDETPLRGNVGEEIGIPQLDSLASSKKTASFVVGAFKIEHDGSISKRNAKPIEVLDTDLGEATEELLLEDTGNATIELFEALDDIDLD